jgi:hypothetical protein
MEQKMKIQLHSTRVTAKSDGGLSFYTNSSSCSYPVLCLEVPFSLLLNADNKAKRKKRRLRDSETTHQMHAAQIYAEILGQVSHKKLYTDNPDGYQEVLSLPNLILIAVIRASRKTRNVLLILCQVSKHIFTRHFSVWSGI